MTQVFLTFSIIDFLPSDFNFNPFSFIFTSQSRDFEQEISYSSKNNISHKFIFNKRDLKYSIKVTKNNSLIGISEIIIPSFIIQKREKNYDKTCSINMTDSIKRVLFGNTSVDNVLKIEIHCSLQYKEKEKNNKMNYSTATNKKNKEIKSLKDMRSSGTFSHKNILENKKSGINPNIKKQYSNSKSNKNIKSPKIIRPKNQVFDYENNEEKKNNKIKENKKEINEENKDIIKKKEIKEKIIDNNIKDSKINESVIDEELNKEINEKNDEFYNFINNFKERHPLEKLDSMNNVKELSEYSKNTILELIEYQMKFYNLCKNAYDKKDKIKNLMLQYNEKYRNTKKEINKIDEKIDLCEIKSEILDKKEYNNIDNLLSLKENELDNFNNIFNKCIEKNKENKTKENNEIQFMEQSKNVLIKVLKQCIDKYGPINKIFTSTNSTEPERTNIRKLANKYNLPINSEIKEEEEIFNQKKEENEGKDINMNLDDNNDKNSIDEVDIKIEKDNINNLDQEIENEEHNESREKNNMLEGKITKWEYVYTEKPDNIDKKLELYLKFFYSKRAFPVVVFKKTSTNNYEYGKQKVMIKIEGDSIRVRHVGGYLIIDKFIELNAANEEKKLKKINEKNMNKKKENIQKKKNK